MTRHQFSVLFVAFSSMILVSHQAPPAFSQSSGPALPQSSAAGVPAVPAQQPSKTDLVDGSPIKLELIDKLDSHTAKTGDRIEFEVVNDVVVGGVVVLRRGSTATGVVTDAASSKTMGRAGRLSFTINDIQLRNGTKAPVRAFNHTSGENRTAEMIGMMVEMPIAAAQFFLLIHGTNTVFPRGTEINAFVNGDIHLSLASFDSPSPVAP